MMLLLSPTYTLRVEVKDRRNDTGVQSMPPPPPHKFYDAIVGKTGCDDVLAAVRDALAKAGLPEVTVSLEKFEHRP